jgi:PleD family two-component response regulator
MAGTVLRPPHLLVASHHAAAGLELQGLAERHGYTVLRAYTAVQALDLAGRAKPDMVILDESLPDIDSLDTARALRDDPAIGSSIPILLITAGHLTTAEHHAALRAGVWENLSHPFDLEEISTKLYNYVLFKLDADRTRARERLADDTGLYTDQGLTLRARELTLQAFHHGAPLACVALAPLVPPGRDPAGPVDFVARVLKASGRRSDAVGRVGANRFAVVAPGTDRVGAVLLAHRLARALRVASPAAPAMRAGYDALANARTTSIEPTHLVRRAVRALEVAEASADPEWIQPYTN